MLKCSDVNGVCVWAILTFTVCLSALVLRGCVTLMSVFVCLLLNLTFSAAVCLCVYFCALICASLCTVTLCVYAYVSERTLINVALQVCNDYVSVCDVLCACVRISVFPPSCLCV